MRGKFSSPDTEKSAFKSVMAVHTEKVFLTGHGECWLGSRTSRQNYRQLTPIYSNSFCNICDNLHIVANLGIFCDIYSDSHRESQLYSLLGQLFRN